MRANGTKFAQPEITFPPAGKQGERVQANDLFKRELHLEAKDWKFRVRYPDLESVARFEK